MIKNIVFDMGNVLICYDPEKTLRKYTDNEDDIKQILDKFYKSELYRDTDRGVKTHAEVIDIISTEISVSAVKLLKKLYVEENYGRTNMPAARPTPFIMWSGMCTSSARRRRPCCNPSGCGRPSARRWRPWRPGAG